MGDPPDRRAWKRASGMKRKRYEEAVEEKTIIVRCNKKPLSERWTAVIAIEELPDMSTDGVKAAVGERFYGAGRAAAELYHEDGIRVADVALLKDGETVYATAGQYEMFVGATQAKDGEEEEEEDATAEKKVAEAAKDGTPEPDRGDSASPPPAVIPAEASVAVRQVLTSRADFVPSEGFVGAKPGYFFAVLDDRGAGYHRDVWVKVTSTQAARAQASLADILSMYGGEEHLGRRRNVHAISDTAAAGGGTARGAMPAPRWDGEDNRQLPARPTEQQVMEAALRQKAEQQRKEEQARAEKAISPAEVAAQRKGTLAGLAQMLRNEMLGDDAKAAIGGGGGDGSFAKFKKKQQQKEKQEESKQAKAAATEALQTAGLVKQDSEDEGPVVEKREKMSKRAKKRARLREEKTQEDSKQA